MLGIAQHQFNLWVCVILVILLYLMILYNCIDRAIDQYNYRKNSGLIPKNSIGPLTAIKELYIGVIRDKLKKIIPQQQNH
jgi:hypothetical protein